MVKRMSISGNLNANTELGAQKASDHVDTDDDESANFDRNQLDEAHGIETVPVPDERDETTEKQNRRQRSMTEDAIMSDNRSRLVGNLDGKRRSKPFKHWLDYKTSQLEERRSKLHSRIIKKSSAVDELLYSSRNNETVREQMIQIDEKFKMLMEVQKEYNSLLPLEMKEQDEEWLDDVDGDMLSFKNKIHNWIKDAELEVYHQALHQRDHQRVTWL